jgi:hypothetical protein
MWKWLVQFYNNNFNIRHMTIQQLKVLQPDITAHLTYDEIGEFVDAVNKKDHDTQIRIMNLVLDREGIGVRIG